jgi:neurotransmitter:Na+ symporter, NSS family
MTEGRDVATDAAPDSSEQHRGAFSSRTVFILAAIGSAVGLGNIWRFPYVAYENGGGAFIIPYLVALVTAGIPFLLMDYALGHKQRGSAPLSFARTLRGSEGLGWWQVGVCFVIAIYYAAVIAWAIRYTLFSVDKAWGDSPEEFFFSSFLEVSSPGVTMDLVPGVLIPLALLWLAVAVVMALGVQKGLGTTALVAMPILVLAFLALVVQALFLDGAAQGLNALFTPDWGALLDASVWTAAFGQIFFSLSIGFGIMITYASYVGKRTDMTGSGLVVGLSNSSFEVLAGIGVFAALGFMAQANGVTVGEVASDGIGLAFIAFPAIINEAPGGAIIGLLFFGSLVVAGLTSLVSVIEVVISAVRDKFEMARVAATMAVMAPTAILSLLLFSTTSGIHVLDILDRFINRYGILLVAVVSMLTLAWSARALTGLANHMNVEGSPRLGRTWVTMLSFVTPLVLAVVLAQELWTDITTPYGDYPGWMLALFGWGVSAAVAVLAFVLARIAWRPDTSLDPQPSAPTTREGGLS